MKLRLGYTFQLTEDAVEHYGEEFSGLYEIDGIFRNDTEHPGYDMGVSPTNLIEAVGLPFAVYEWEIELV